MVVFNVKFGNSSPNLNAILFARHKQWKRMFFFLYLKGRLMVYIKRRVKDVIRLAIKKKLHHRSSLERIRKKENETNWRSNDIYLLHWRMNRIFILPSSFLPCFTSFNRDFFCSRFESRKIEKIVSFGLFLKIWLIKDLSRWITIVIHSFFISYISIEGEDDYSTNKITEEVWGDLIDCLYLKNLHTSILEQKQRKRIIVSNEVFHRDSLLPSTMSTNKSFDWDDEQNQKNDVSLEVLHW